MRLLATAASLLLLSSSPAPEKCFIPPEPPAPTFPEHKAPEKGGVMVMALNREVEANIVQHLIEGIALANESEASVIIMKINSPGGSVMDGMDLTAAMEASAVPIQCEVDGMAASMALYILQSCHVRVMSMRSVLMAHEPSVGILGRLGPQDAAMLAERLRVITRMIAEHTAARMHLTTDEFLKKIEGKEWWITWDEAFVVGAVDAVRDSPNSKMSPPKAPKK